EEQYTEAEGWFIRLSQRAPYHEETYHFWMQMCRETGQEKKSKPFIDYGKKRWKKNMECWLVGVLQQKKINRDPVILMGANPMNFLPVIKRNANKRFDDNTLK